MIPHPAFQFRRPRRSFAVSLRHQDVRTLAWQLTVGPALAGATIVTLCDGVLVDAFDGRPLDLEITRRETVLSRACRICWAPTTSRTLRIESELPCGHSTLQRILFDSFNTRHSQSAIETPSSSPPSNTNRQVSWCAQGR